MVCSNCGAPIPEGALFCVSCGSPVSSSTAPQMSGTVQSQEPQGPQPVQLQEPQGPQPGQYGQPQGPQSGQYGQPQGPQPGQFGQPQGPQPGQYGQPQGPQPGQFGQPMPGMGGAGIQGFLNRMKAEPLRWTEVGGIVAVFLALIIPTWSYVSFFGYREYIGLWKFDVIGPIMGLIIFLATVAAALIQLDVIPPISPYINKFKALPFSQFYYPACVFLMWFFIWIFSVGTISHSEYAKYGFSFYFCFIGIGLLLIVPIMKLVKKQNYYA
ncbi:MAG: zinc ribbon domain-containing protein [Eubacterium sp.]|nr:zinc ribbon domain-containing protein [Eubacterium sp.]